MNKKHEKLVEEIAALEHEQWMKWSKEVAPEVSEERRKRWEKYWVPYEELSEAVKEYDRIWARPVISYILQAVESGELMLTKVPPKLPGEVGRFRLWDSADIMGELVGCGGQILIALSPEGQEGE